MIQYPNTSESITTMIFCAKRFVFLFLLSQKLFSISLSPKKNSLLNHENVRWGLSVYSLKNEKYLFQKNENESFIAASVTKLITSSAVLHQLGGHYQFETKIFTDGTISEGGILRGNLIIVGSGDPFLTNEKLWQAASDLSHLGVKKIEGGIYIDNSLFSSPSRDKSREEGSKFSRNAYDAPISALGINFNTIAIAIAPGFKTQKNAIVELDPYPLSNIKIKNATVTTNSNNKSNITITRESKNNIEWLSANGKINFSDELKKIYRSVGEPEKTVGEYFLAFFKGRAIDIKKGFLGERKNSEKNKLLLTIESFPLSFIVQGLNKFSNNYIADMLVNKLGEDTDDKMTTHEKGISRLQLFLKDEVKIKNNFSLVNGSGLDPENRFSPNQLVDVLNYSESKMEVFPDFISALPIAGEDGTLEKRFNSPTTQKLRGKIRGKTGSLSSPVSVVNVAGYYRHPKHGLLSFSLMLNGIEEKKQFDMDSIKSAQDEFLTELFDAI